jgi:hypothetical protein
MILWIYPIIFRNIILYIYMISYDTRYPGWNSPVHGYFWQNFSFWSPYHLCLWVWVFLKWNLKQIRCFCKTKSNENDSVDFFCPLCWGRGADPASDLGRCKACACSLSRGSLFRDEFGASVRFRVRYLPPVDDDDEPSVAVVFRLSFDHP